MKRRLQPGFTVLELTFAIILIGVMMTIVMATIIGMLRFYNFSSSVRVNQAAGRQAMDDIARQVRFSDLVAPISTDGTTQSSLCVFASTDRQVVQYTLSGGRVMKGTKAWVNDNLPTASDCTGLTSTAITPKSMFVKSLSFTRTAGAATVSNQAAAAVIYDMDFINGTYDTATIACKTGDIYCSELKFTTAVNIRGKS